MVLKDTKAFLQPTGNLVLPPLAKKDPVGQLDLHIDLPLNIANGYTKILVWDDPISELHKSCASKLVSLAHYKACSQLYETLNYQTKSQLHIFLPIMKDNTAIPRRMAQAISMVGNFQVNTGEIAISHAQLLFYRWLLAGLSKDPNFTGRSDEYPTNCQDAYKCVWNDGISKALINELCLKQINARRQPFSISLQPQVQAYVTISVPSKEDAATWYKTVPYQAPFYSELIAIGKLYALSYEEWIRCKYDPETIQVALDQIGCKLSPLDPKKMIEDFIEAQKGYNDGHLEIKKHLDSYFLMSNYTTKRTGSRAQLVTSTVDEADWQIPVPDDEANMGFLFNPCADFTFAPHYKSHSRKRRNDARIDSAKTDLKNSL